MEAARKKQGRKPRQEQGSGFKINMGNGLGKAILAGVLAFGGLGFLTYDNIGRNYDEDSPLIQADNGGVYIDYTTLGIMATFAGASMMGRQLFRDGEQERIKKIREKSWGEIEQELHPLEPGPSLNPLDYIQPGDRISANLF